MALTSKNVIVLYRDGDSESYEFARYYAAARNLEDNQLVSVECTSTEVLESYESFYNEVERFVLDALSDPYVHDQVLCIIVGFRVPGGFLHNGNTISSTSRLSRIYTEFTSEKIYNPLYSRATYTEYGLDDVEKALVVSRIDAPTLEIAKRIVDAGKNISRQGRVNGKFFFDRDAVPDDANEEEYASQLETFESFVLPSLNIEANKTYHWDEYTDVPLFRLNKDSFVWAWKNDRVGYTFFEKSKPIRVFLYNADRGPADSTSMTLRDINERRWVLLALSSGYATSAGSMSDPGTNGYLNPSSFFRSLARGNCVGEAFLYSVPYLDWTVSLFGDPLVSVNFPATAQVSDAEGIVTVFESMEELFSDAMGYMMSRYNAMLSIRDILSPYPDLDLAVDVRLVVLSAMSTCAKDAIQPFRSAAKNLLKFPDDNFSSYLENNEIKVSRLTVDAAYNPQIQIDSLYDTGEWVIEFDIKHSSILYCTYKFHIQVFSDRLYTDLIISSDSTEDGWTYEKELNVFEPLPSDGVPCYYKGRRVRYKGAMTLPRGTLLYAKINQENDSGEFTDDVEIMKVVKR